MTQKVTVILTTVCEAAARTAQGNYCKKSKLNVTVNDYTYPSPNKAIQQKKIEVNNNLTSGVMQENISHQCFQ